MERRFQVFVSSTYEDLVEERQEVMQALLELDCIPAGMELFPAADEDQWSLIKRVIQDCDYYIVIIGGRYGSISPKGVSYTQLEYEYAVEIGKPVIAFVHKDPGKLVAEKTEREPEAREKLEEFISVVQRKMVKHWTTASDLGSVVSRSLVKLMKMRPAVGWVRADVLPSQGAMEEILTLRRRIDELESELESSSLSAPVGTEDLAQGEDLVELKFTFVAYRAKTYRRLTYESTYETSWNAIFSRISPVLIDEASEWDIRQVLNSLVAEEMTPELESRERVQGCKLSDFEVDQDSFYTVTVQFLATGLIRKGDRIRSVKDRSTYLVLTPYGERMMMQLRAIKRSDSGLTTSV